MKNLVEFKNFIEPLIEEFEKSDFFQQLNAEAQKNAPLFTTNFVKHAGNMFDNPIDLTTWESKSTLDVYSMTIITFKWGELKTLPEGEFFISQIEQCKDSIIAFLQFLSVQRLEIPNISETITLIEEDYAAYISSDKMKKTIYFLSDIYSSAIENGVDIYNSHKMEKFIDQKIEKLNIMNKFDDLVDKFGMDKALQKLNPRETDIVMAELVEDNEITEDNIDVELGKKLQFETMMMQMKGDSDEKISQFIKQLSQLEQNSLFYVMQQEMKSNGTNNGIPVRTEPKIGRNEPCPCGSGKKYKKCCGK